VLQSRSAFANRDILNLAESFHAIESLKPNWDGYGAERILPIIRVNARAIALRLMGMGAPAPEVTPTPDGTIELEWDLPSGRAHLEIGATTFSFVMHMRAGGKALTAGSINADMTRAASFICTQICQADPATNSFTAIDWIFRAHGV
jgi:hypothetical protein